MEISYKEKAILLRKEGKTYREILLEIPVAKSTLSEWLKSVGLSASQKHRITDVRIKAAMRGAQARRTIRLNDVSTYISKGKNEVRTLSRRELWLIGIALYWAEGSKQTSKSPSAGLSFINTDPSMLRVYLSWLRICGINENAIRYDLYIHEDRRYDAEVFRIWWQEQLGIPAILPDQVYFKKGNIITKRSNVDDLYHGILRIKVKMSTSLNRQVNGWIKGISTSLPE